MTQQVELSDFERRAEQRARHRAYILQILNAYPEGLTTQQIVDREEEFFGFKFLTDNRLRELRDKGFVETVQREGQVQLWRVKEEKEKLP